MRGRRTTGPGPNPSGLCMCGCGTKTELSKHSSSRRDEVKGTPKKYARGHHGRNDWLVVPESGCWEWQGYISPRGYGVKSLKALGVDGIRRAHLWVYEQHRGP